MRIRELESTLTHIRKDVAEELSHRFEAVMIGMEKMAEKSSPRPQCGGLSEP